MAKRKEITVTIKGLDTKENKEEFCKRCAEFWTEIISEKVSELPISHEEKVAFAKEVVEEIHKRKKGG